MKEPTLDRNLSDRYLRILCLEPKKPSLEFLNALVRAQLRWIPYENISKILRVGKHGPGLPTIEEFLGNAEEFGFGGTCYVQNGYFHWLLKSLEFNSDLVSSSTDTHPDSHAACRVQIENASFLVDLGLFSTFAGPFELKRGCIVRERQGAVEHVFEAFDRETYQIQVFKNDLLSRSHRGSRPARDLGFFEDAVKSTFDIDAMFMTTIVAHRMLLDGPVFNWGRTLIKFVGDMQTKYELKNAEEMVNAYCKLLELPRYPIRQALDVLSERNNTQIF